MRHILWRLAVYTCLGVVLGGGYYYIWQRAKPPEDTDLKRRLHDLDKLVARKTAAHEAARQANPLGYQARAEFPCALASPSRVVISPDSKLVAALNTDDKVQVWNLPAGTLVQTLSFPAKPVDLALANQVLVAACADSTAYVMDPATGARLADHHTDDPLLSVAVSPDGKTAYLGPKDEDTVIAWTIADGKTRRFEPLDCGDPQQLLVSPDGSYLAWKYANASLVICNTTSGEEVGHISEGPATVRPAGGPLPNGINLLPTWYWVDLNEWPERDVLQFVGHRGLMGFDVTSGEGKMTLYWGSGSDYAADANVGYMERAHDEWHRGGTQDVVPAAGVMAFASPRGLVLGAMESQRRLYLDSPASATCIRVSPDHKLLLCYGVPPTAEHTAAKHEMYVWDVPAVLRRLTAQDGQ